MIRRAALLFGAILMMASPSAGQETAVAQCDRLARAEVALAPADATAALEACGQALAADPTNGALLFQYARALEALGRPGDARRIYEWAADQGDLAAAAALERLGPTTGGVPDWAAGEREALADATAALSASLRRYVNGLPADPSDPLTVLVETGPDPAAILAWVAANTRLVAYPGSLRGPRGVLSDRAGSSLDRALLLAELLNAAGVETRIARVSLDAAAAEALLPATGQIVGVPGLASVPRADLVAMFADERLPRDVMTAAIDATLAGDARIANDVPAMRDAILPVLADATAGVAPAADATIRTAALAALADHFWVQARRGEAWVDVDPDAAALGPLVAAETFEPAAVPDDLRHQVTIRVVLELQDASGRREQTLLEHSWFPAHRPVEALVLSHAFAGLDAIDQLVEEPGAGDRALEILTAEDAWTPLLRSDDTLVVDQVFTADGEVRAANLNPFAGLGGAVGGLFDALSGSATPVTEPAVPTAEWIEVEVRVPGEPTRIERRAVFDLVGAAARAAGALVAIEPDLVRQRALALAGPIDILVFAAAPSDVELARTIANAVAETADAMRVATTGETFPPIDALVPPSPVPVALLTYANARYMDGAQPPVAAPNVVFLHQRLGWRDGNVTRTPEFDIVFNAVGGGFAGRLEQGVLDTAIEAAILDGTAMNAAAIHAADIAGGRPWSLLDPTADRTGDADAVTRLRADEVSGYLVVARPDLADPNTAAWWRIDPTTGGTVGMMAAGGGAAFGEAALLFVEGATTAGCFVGIGLGIAAVLGIPGGSVRKGVGLCLLAAGVGGLGLGIGLGVGGVGIFAILSVAGVAAAAGQ